MATKVSARRRKYLTLALAAILTIGVAGVAVAYWTATGSGDGSAQTGTSTVFTVETEDAAGTIAPGTAGQSVDFTITNPGPGTQFLTAVTVSMAGATGVAWTPPTGCLVGDYTATLTTPPSYGELAVNDEVTGTVTVTLADTGANQDACKNAVVPLYFVAS
jgi:hypothetical protein